jgi:glutamine synthetase
MVMRRNLYLPYLYLYVSAVYVDVSYREVAPNQYEFAPLFGSVTTQIDQNLVVMQIIDEVATQYGLAALLQEKPFQVTPLCHVTQRNAEKRSETTNQS